jgi:hypothetical protein
VGAGVIAVAAAIAIVVPLTVGSGLTGTTRQPAVAGRPRSSPTTTTSDPNAEPLVPEGFALSDDGAIRTLRSTTQPPHDASASPGGGASSTATGRAQVVSSSSGPVLRSVTVQFNCLRLPEKIQEVSYTLTPGALLVQASLAFVADGKACPSPGKGPVITLPLSAPLPAGTKVVVGSVPSH